MLFVKPLQEPLESRISLDFGRGVEGIPQLVVRPRLVNEVLTRMTGRLCVTSAFAPGYYVMLARGYVAQAEYAAVAHSSQYLPRNPRLLPDDLPQGTVEFLLVGSNIADAA